MTDTLGKPDLLVTLSDNPHDPRLSACVHDGPFATWIPDPIDLANLPQLDEVYRKRFAEEQATGKRPPSTGEVQDFPEGEAFSHEAHYAEFPHRYGDESIPGIGPRLHKEFSRAWADGPVHVNNSYEVVVNFFQRLQLFMNEFLYKQGREVFVYLDE
jgi:hypothetical protein